MKNIKILLQQHLFVRISAFSLLFLALYSIFSPMTFATQDCRRCSNRVGCTLASFQSDDGCQNPSGPVNYSSLVTCGPIVNNPEADNSACPVPLGPSCTRCSNKIGCMMATFQSNDNCYNPSGPVTYTPNTDPCGPVPATADNPNPDNSRCEAPVAVPTPTTAPVSVAVACSDRCSTSNGCEWVSNIYAASTDACISNPDTSNVQRVSDDGTRCGPIEGSDNVSCPSNLTCPKLPANAPTLYTTITVPSAGLYKVWTRMKANSANNANAYYLQVDNRCGIVVGDAQSINSTSWSWVDYQNGTTGSKVTMYLLPGVHTVKMVTKEYGVLLDRVFFTSNQSCTPSAAGDCL